MHSFYDFACKLILFMISSCKAQMFKTRIPTNTPFGREVRSAVSPTPEYAKEFLDALTWTRVPPVGSSGEEFMLEVWELLSEKGYC